MKNTLVDIIRGQFDLLALRSWQIAELACNKKDIRK